MGSKKVCFDCRKAFSVYNNDAEKINLTCPECGKQTTIFSHLFRPPKQDDLKRWKVVEFLKDHGFLYQHVYEVEAESLLHSQVQYPETMNEAQVFVARYKNQAYKLK